MRLLDFEGPDAAGPEVVCGVGGCSGEGEDGAGGGDGEFRSESTGGEVCWVEGLSRGTVGGLVDEEAVGEECEGG